MIQIARFSLNEILPLIGMGKPRIWLAGLSVKAGSTRLECLKRNQTCVWCKRKGTIFVLEKHKQGAPKGINCFIENYQSCYYQRAEGVAKHLSGMAQELMRRPSGLTVGERELIAAFSSKMNDCQFCYRSHKSCAEETGNREVVNDVLENESWGALSTKMRALLTLSYHVGKLNRSALPEAVEDAKLFGATDQDIHDTVAITAFFNMCNRYVDGLGTTYKSGEEIEGGKSLAKYGYMMTIRRFFGEILPQMFSRKKAMSSALTR